MVDIERVWVTIDHKLFLWDYNDGCVHRISPTMSPLFNNFSQEIASFMDQPDVIREVALVKPKPGVFIDDITFLLVICTPVSVLLIGVALANQPTPDGRPHKELKLYATDLVVPTDVEMTAVAGTADGRIFMSGHDGRLYEFHYQATETWFAKRVHLINHSQSGVQSLLPRFAAATVSEGMSFCPLLSPSFISRPQTPFLQSLLTSKEIVSTHLHPTTIYRCIPFPATRPYNMFRQSLLCTRVLRKRHLAPLR